MSESLAYYDHNASFNAPNRKGVLSKANEVHELAADIQHLAVVALLSEANAANIVGVPLEVSVPNPIANYSERRTVKSIYGKGKERHERIESVLSRGSETLDELQTSLNAYANTGQTEGHLKDVVPTSRGTGVLREMEENGNHRMILDGTGIPPFIKLAKDLQAKAEVRDPEGYSWEDYFSSASEEQLINFSQAYTERLKILADPESKAGYIESLKTDYKDRVVQAMQDGWIDGKHKPVLDRRIANADVRFFSLFGHMPNHVAGLTEGSDFNKRFVFLPTITGEQLTVHEFGHVFAGIRMGSMQDYFDKKLGKGESARKSDNLMHLYTVLNEGYNDHMTAALVDGDPTNIIPTERDSKGVVETEGGSKVYKTYRLIFGVLLGGKDGNVDGDDIKRVVDSMVSGDFEQFAGLLDAKWGGRNVLVETLEVVERHHKEEVLDIDDHQYNENLLARNITERLISGKVLAPGLNKR